MRDSDDDLQAILAGANEPLVMAVLVRNLTPSAPSSRATATSGTTS